jgi:RimJ/RimL family protein N-acetyltransferase
MNVLETQRLVLRRLTTDDADFILELMNEPSFIRFVADRGLRTTADAAQFLRERLLPSYEQFGFGFYRVALKESGEPVGICGLVKRETLEHADVGFSILQRFCGQGFAYEAAAAVMDYGRTQLGLATIIGVTAPDNQISRRLLEKLGLRYQRTIHLPGYGPKSLLFG